MVKPGGTGIPRLVISASSQPLPPSRLRISDEPSALPEPKEYTNFVIGAGLRPGRQEKSFNITGLRAAVSIFPPGAAFLPVTTTALDSCLVCLSPTKRKGHGSPDP